MKKITTATNTRKANISNEPIRKLYKVPKPEKPYEFQKDHQLLFQVIQY